MAAPERVARELHAHAGEDDRAEEHVVGDAQPLRVEEHRQRQEQRRVQEEEVAGPPRVRAVPEEVTRVDEHDGQGGDRDGDGGGAVTAPEGREGDETRDERRAVEEDALAERQEKPPQTDEESFAKEPLVVREGRVDDGPPADPGIGGRERREGGEADETPGGQAREIAGAATVLEHQEDRSC